MRWFDYEGVAREAGIPDGKLAHLVRRTRAEYGNDDMLFELRMLRTCRAIQQGYLTIDEALRPDPTALADDPVGAATRAETD